MDLINEKLSINHHFTFNIIKKQLKIKSWLLFI